MFLHRHFDFSQEETKKTETQRQTPSTVDDLDDDFEFLCPVCGCWTSECVCPPCYVCGSIGNPACYTDGHGMRRTKAQLISHTKMYIEDLELQLEDEQEYLEHLEQLPDDFLEEVPFERMEEGETDGSFLISEQ